MEDQRVQGKIIHKNVTKRNRMEERGEGRDRLFYFDSGWDSGGLFLDGKEP